MNPRAYPEMEGHIRDQGRTPAGTHVPVLVEEVMAALKPSPGEIIADCTVGYGGHALEFLKRLFSQGRLIGLDVDAATLEQTRTRLSEAGFKVALYRRHFAGLGQVLADEGLDGFDIIFADLGVSSMQVDDPRRGFSYKHDGPLDMRMDDRLPLTAGDRLMRMSQRELAATLAELADEPDAEAIARAVVEQRGKTPLTTTSQLVQLIFQAKDLSWRTWRSRKQASSNRSGLPPLPSRERAGVRVECEISRSDLHPAALTFQALRILINDELNGLKQLLRIAPHCLRPGGRIGIISFHSGEDRLVKHSFRDGIRSGVYSAISEEPIRPTPEERRSNPRSASAKFRWAIRR